MKSVRDVFICAFIFSAVVAFAQLDPRERYGTYLGGSLADCYDSNPGFDCGSVGHHYFPAGTTATAIAIDKSGYVYIAGSTSAIDFPTTSGAYRRTARYARDSFGNLLSSDSFVSKFTSAGALVWSTYLGLVATPEAISFDSSGNVTVLGNVNTGSLARYPFDSPFVLKLNTTATTLLAYKQLITDPNCAGGLGAYNASAAVDSSGAIYLGGSENEPESCLAATPGANQSGSGFLVKLNSALSTVYVARTDGPAKGIAADSSGNACMTSATTSSNSPYIAKLDSKGALSFTYSFGNSGTGVAIRVASNGDIIATGNAGDSSFSATANFGTPTQGGTETFIVRLHSTGGLVYSAVIHDDNMYPHALALNSANEAFVTGTKTNTSAFSVNRYSNAPSAGSFLVRLNQTGTALWLDSPFGGDTGNAIAVDPAWNAWVAGVSGAATYFPITANAYQSSFKNAQSQGFVAKLIIEADVKMLTQKISANPVAHGSNLTYTFAVYNAGPDVSDGDTLTDILPAGTTFVSFTNTNGGCTHPNVGSVGTFKCTRSAALNKGNYWGPITLTVHVNAASGSALTNTASVAAKTQDVFLTNNSSTTSVKVQ